MYKHSHKHPSEKIRLLQQNKNTITARVTNSKNNENDTNFHLNSIENRFRKLEDTLQIILDATVNNQKNDSTATQQLPNQTVLYFNALESQNYKPNIVEQTNMQTAINDSFDESFHTIPLIIEKNEKKCHFPPGRWFYTHPNPTDISRTKCYRHGNNEIYQIREKQPNKTKTTT